MNFEDISGLLAGLSQEDMAALSSAAGQLFGGDGDEEKEKSADKACGEDNIFGGIDPQIIAKIMQLMPLLQGGADNERTRLIHALKPLLSPARRKKADEAMQLMRIMDMLPMIFNLSGDCRG